MGNSQSSIKKEIEKGISSGKTDWYELQKQIGKGRFGVIYRCRLVKGMKHVAVKCIANEDVNDSMKKLIRHISEKNLKNDHIIQHYNYTDSVLQQKFYVFMEYAKFGSLKEFYCTLKKGFEESVVGNYTRQIIMGLQYLHGQHIVHRDIKCENILLSNLLLVKIGDLELAKVLSSKDEKITEKCGTDFFMAPEVKAEEPYDFSADIWSLGATILEMSIGRIPDQLDNNKTSNNPFAFYEDEVQDTEIKKCLKLCLLTNPGERVSFKTLLKLPICSSEITISQQQADLMTALKEKTSERIKNQIDTDLEKMSFFANLLKEIENPTNVQNQQTNPISDCDVKSKVTMIIKDNIQNCHEEKALRKGNFGKTFCCQIRDQNICFAKKVIDKTDLTPRRQTQLVQICQYFEKVSLSHEHVIQFYCSKSTPDEFHVYTEFAQYGSLEDLYKRNGGFIDHQIGFYIKQVLLGLQYLHSKRIIHSGVKCSNILLAKRDKIKLGDYALSKVMKEKTRESSTQNLTANILAPEINAGQAYSYPADIWSVGATVIEMKIGGPPSQLSNLLRDQDPLRNYRDQGFSEDVMYFLEKCLKREVSERESIEQLLILSLCKLCNFADANVAEIKRDVAKCVEYTKKIIPLFFPWQAKCAELINSFIEMGELFDKYFYQKNVTQATGSTAGIVGGVISGVGLILAPFTFGASLGLGIAGVSLAAAGGAVSIGGSSGEYHNSKKLWENIEIELKKYQEEFDILIELWRQLFEIIFEKKLLNRIHFLVTVDHAFANSLILEAMQPKEGLNSGDLLANAIVNPLRCGLNIFADIFESFLAPIATTAGRVSVRIVAGVFNIAFIAVDAVFLARATRDIMNGSISESGEKLRNHAEQLQNNLIKMETFYKTLMPQIRFDEAPNSESLLGSVLG